MRKTGFATIGTSKITEKFLQAAKEYPKFQYVAAYSRDIKKAEEFADIHGVEKAYNSLDMLSADSGGGSCLCGNAQSYAL